MGLILSIFAALGGSVAGAAVRAGITVVDQQLAKRESDASEPMMINGSLVGGVAAGVVADAVGGGVGLAFWLGAVLGAAGADRLDWWVLERVGVDRDALIARARKAAERAQRQARKAVPISEEAVEA
ncbi:MAG: hypothetical protein E6J50_00715 [Chloroflexi bacterium]|nr:MAG: hypothetical protein E6J50_00715 [Chloroflexota bacterium]